MVSLESTPNKLTAYDLPSLHVFPENCSKTPSFTRTKTTELISWFLIQLERSFIVAYSALHGFFFASISCLELRSYSCSSNFSNQDAPQQHICCISHSLKCPSLKTLLPPDLSSDLTICEWEYILQASRLLQLLLLCSNVLSLYTHYMLWIRGQQTMVRPWVKSVCHLFL